MRSTFKILFYINRQKTKADGRTTILCRITIDGKSSAITTGEECLQAEWNAKQGQTTDKRINKKLTAFRELVENTYRDLLVSDGVVSVELIKEPLARYCHLSDNVACHEQDGIAIRQRVRG